MATDELTGPIDYRELLKQARVALVGNPVPGVVEQARVKAERAAEEAPRREDRAEFCQVLAQHYHNYAMPEEAGKWIEEAERLSQGVPRLEAMSAYVHASLLHRSFEFQKALDKLEPLARSIDAETDLSLAARVQTLYAGVLDQLGRIDEADAAFKTALELRERDGDKTGLAVVYYNYGEFCSQRDDDLRALEYMHKAYELEKELNLPHSVAQSAMQISLLYAQQGDEEQALAYFDEARHAAKQADVPAITAFVKANAASLYERLGDETSQLAALLDAKTYLDRHPFDVIRVLVLGNLGELYVRHGKYDLAEPLLERALKMARRDKHAYAEGQWLYAMGLLRKGQGRLSEAASLLTNAVNILSDVKAHVLTLRAFSDLAIVQSEMGAHTDACQTMAEWARTYVEEHDENVQRQLKTVREHRQKDREESQAEIYRLKNVELSAAMDQLKVVNNELRDLAVEKDEFMAIAAHDLRNPLADMRSMLQTVINHFDILSKDDILDISRDLLATTTRMSATVHAFLEISRTDRRSSGLQDETVDLVHLAHRAVERFAPRAQGKSITLVVDAPQPVFAQGDASVVDAVLDNLISNALKFVPADTTVTLAVARDGKECTVRVIDEGPGVSEADRPKLFTKYGKLSTRPTAGEDSLGLGLYLARRMAERMNAHLEYEPRETGACFVLRVPQAEA